ncbi:DUF6545 domain-containing protein [Kitasatospora misakiensis]|uniref:DUF6545 domain-containing protein n=1 Tax=Kitasatospora misakiensis TaxID=67330 RepID=A0ABW0X7N6_9ACTN
MADQETGAPGGPVRDWSDHRRLGPLWSVLRSELPEIELVTPEQRFGSVGGRRPGIRFALFRRIIEIRDGQLSLRPYLHPRVPFWVGEVVRPAGTEEFAVLVEAATVAAALEAARAGHRFPVGPGGGWVPHPLAAGLREEAAWLAKVARAYRRSPVMAHVRRRVRAELAGAATPGPALPPPPVAQG